MLCAFEFKERDMIEIHYEMEHFSVQLKVFLSTKFYLWLSTNFSRTDILLHICQFIAHSIVMTRWAVWTVAELWLRSSLYDLGCTYRGLVPWAPVALLMNISIFKSLLFNLTIGIFYMIWHEGRFYKSQHLAKPMRCTNVGDCCN